MQFRTMQAGVVVINGREIKIEAGDTATEVYGKLREGASLESAVQSIDPGRRYLCEEGCRLHNLATRYNLLLIFTEAVHR